MKQILVLALIALGNYCCAQERMANIIPYAFDASLSDKNGKPIRANGLELFAYPNTPYFPVLHFQDTLHWVHNIADNSKEYDWRKHGTLHQDCRALTLEEYGKKENVDISTIIDTLQYEVDTSQLGWFSRDMYYLGEPILYNYPLKNEVIRFTLLRSFHPPLAIRLENEKGKYRIFMKELNKNIEHDATLVIDWGKSTQKDSLVKADNSDLHLTIDYTNNITGEQFESIKTLITQSAIKCEPHRVRRGCNWITDGAQWILEIQDESGYFFMDRHSPKKQAINEVGRMMIKLAGYKGEIY